MFEREFLAGAEGARTPVMLWGPTRCSISPTPKGNFPSGRYPVMWLVIGNAPVPFGERVQLNEA